MFLQRKHTLCMEQQIVFKLFLIQINWELSDGGDAELT